MEMAISALMAVGAGNTKERKEQDNAKLSEFLNSPLRDKCRISSSVASQPDRKIKRLKNLLQSIILTDHLGLSVTLCRTPLRKSHLS